MDPARKSESTTNDGGAVEESHCPRVLIHPNTGDAYKDHTELATWMGKSWPIHTEILKDFSR